VLDGVALGLCVLGIAAGGVRWLRVAQREHYLPGCASLFAHRWWRAGQVNTAAFVAALAAVVIGVFHASTAGIAGLVTVVGPVGLGVRGRTSALAWTARLRRIAFTSALVNGVVMAIAAALGGLATATVAAAVLALGTPTIVDLVLFVLAPVEDRLAMRFVDQAARILRRVDPIVVGITGSYGKTSTKGFVAHLLASRYSVVASPKSFNNRAGLARTVNEHLVVGTDVLVAEMGTYGPGEIAAMTAWLPPKIAVITAIGPVHLERFGSLDRTVAAKAEITAPAEVVVLNIDDERLGPLAGVLAAAGKRVIGCSARDPGADVALVEDAIGLGLFVGGDRVADLDPHAPGLGAARTNVAAAIGVAIALGCTPEEIVPRLGNLPIAENRLTRSVGSSGVLILDDTFNANPAGARIALETLAAAPQERRVLVTPGMVELGPLQAEENEAFAAQAATIVDDLVVVSRTNRRALVAGARRANPDIALRVAPTREAAVAWVRAELDERAVVLYENDLPDHYA
jgi:UDP-N-acetylmuramoyl-tripeptide--D-alanyl-D-alanine ligase